MGGEGVERTGEEQQRVALDVVEQRDAAEVEGVVAGQEVLLGQVVAYLEQRCRRLVGDAG